MRKAQNWQTTAAFAHVLDVMGSVVEPAWFPLLAGLQETIPGSFLSSVSWVTPTLRMRLEVGLAIAQRLFAEHEQSVLWGRSKQVT